MTYALSDLLFCNLESMTYPHSHKTTVGAPAISSRFQEIRNRERVKRRKDFAYDRKAKPSQKTPVSFHTLTRSVLFEQRELQEKLGNVVFSQVYCSLQMFCISLRKEKSESR